MAQSKITTFLHYVDPELLRQYFTKQRVEIEVPPEEDLKTFISQLEQNLDTLPDKDKRELVYSDVIEVCDMAHEGGIQSLLTLTQEREQLADQIRNLPSPYNQAFYCLIHEPEVFKNAAILYAVTDLRAKAERAGLKKVTTQEAIKRQEQLALELKSYFNTEDGRGEACHINICSLPDRVCFLINCKDYLKTETYFEGNTYKRSVRNTCFQIIYVYYPDEGRLELAARGGKSRQLELFNIFNRAILADETPVKETQLIYDLNTILDSDFELSQDEADQLERLFLKQIRFASRYNFKDRIILELDSGEGIETMMRKIDAHRIDMRHYTPTQATFKFKFPGKGNKGSVTMQLTMPDRNNLSDNPTHIQAKKYLEKWKLINESEFKSTPTESLE